MKKSDERLHRNLKLHNKYWLIVMYALTAIIGIIYINIIFHVEKKPEIAESTEININKTAEYEKYTDIAMLVADIKVGLEVTKGEYNSISHMLSTEAVKDIQNMLSVKTTGTYSNSSENIDEQLDELFGGNTSKNKDKYKMWVVDRSFYYPHLYIYKLINNSGSLVIVNIETDEDGSVTNVKATD